MNILDVIVEEKKKEIELLPEQTINVEILKSALSFRGGDCRDFIGTLKNPRRSNVALIAEVKKASPSAGVICENFDHIRIAREYEKCGATCISVLTDVKFFQGAPQYLSDIRKTVALPLLRKDFIIDERQILESIQLGADAILLIVAILDMQKLKRLHELIIKTGLSALVEVHDEEELLIAAEIGAKLIGINNRNLKTFKVDLSTTERLAKMARSLPGGDLLTIVAESGISRKEDVMRVYNAGANAILVGESLLRTGTISERIDTLLR
ncbi:MAG: indole-3-glycerol phosphate synthase TrpC [Verrucomicrobiae bacterium]|nr:indole-3-glycerol phosphate synthase TrpC [Verrucomicrobiae bacterium]